ncbi:serine protease easter isoform X3 [Stomoxys calcitrans]|uniref:CLIP domain-containing serine protease n=1 Tax=Stomoxys calcitrans TaxID=35570 RepID=A0A1I8PEC1_STOCA|nr:serine protease easter isoform X3 [Stomoxys calcitrans]
MRYSLKTHIIACIIAAFCVNGSLSQINQQCYTPDRALGQCVNIVDCPASLEVLRNVQRTPQETQYLQQSLCAQVGSVVYICCKFQNRNTANEIGLLPTTRECGKSFENRIIGGNVTRIDEYPWLALIEYTKPGNAKGFHCGAALINKRYVISAAHCVIGSGLPAGWLPTGIRLGEWDRTTTRDCETSVNNRLECADPHLDVAIEEIVSHPGYNSRDTNRWNDIALIRLSREVAYTDFVSPVCLPIQTEMRSRTFEAQKLDVIGFGATEFGTSSARKLKASIDAWNFETCRQRYATRRISLQDTQMCAGGQAGVDSCSGDSGGPLVVKQRLDNRDVYVLAGLVSFGPTQCGTADWPGVYTRVGAYADWILNSIKA